MQYTAFVSIDKAQSLGVIDPTSPRTPSFEEVEAGMIRAALKRAHGNVAKAAAILGTEVDCVWDRMAAYAIEG